MEELFINAHNIPSTFAITGGSSIMAITRLPATALIIPLPSTITSASGLSLGKILQVVQTIDKNQVDLL